MKTHTLIPLTMLMCCLAILHSGAKAAPEESARAEAPGSSPGVALELEDRVGFPRDYATSMRRVGDSLYDEKFGLTTVFANDLAVSVAGFSQQRHPNGSVILMEFAQPQRDGEGELMRDARGQPLKGPIDHIDVMRRGAGFGASYGKERAGEWEFASYRPDGSTRVAPDKAVHCASCHSKAGADKDFVFRIRRWSAAN